LRGVRRDATQGGYPTANPAAMGDYVRMRRWCEEHENEFEETEFVRVDGIWYHLRGERHPASLLLNVGPLAEFPLMGPDVEKDFG